MLLTIRVEFVTGFSGSSSSSDARFLPKTGSDLRADTLGIAEELLEVDAFLALVVVVEGVKLVELIGSLVVVVGVGIVVLLALVVVDGRVVIVELAVIFVVVV